MGQIAENDDAQVRLERQALKNSRALLDKLEAEKVRGVRDVWKPLLAAGLLFVAIAAGMYFYPALLPGPKPTSEMTSAEYVEHCLAKIEKNARGSTSRRRVDGLGGAAVLTLKVRQDGNADVEITRSSGDKQLDAAFVAFARGGQPFGNMPKGAATAGQVLQLSRTFRLERDKAELVIDRAPVGST